MEKDKSHRKMSKMSSSKKGHGRSKGKRAAKSEIKASNTQMLENTTNVAVPSTEPQFRDKEGDKTKKRKSGEVKRDIGIELLDHQDVGIEWLDHQERLAFRAKELLHGIKKRQTSGKMIDKQLEFTTKLAQLEEACYVIEAERADNGTSQHIKVPTPAAWVTNPTPLPHWSTLEGRMCVDDETSSVSSDEFQAFEETEESVKPCKLTDCMKQMCVEADGALLRSWYSSELGARLRAAGARLREARGAPHGVLRVTRDRVRGLRADDAQMLQVSAGRVQCLRYLYVCEAQRAGRGGGAGDAGDEGLAGYEEGDEGEAVEGQLSALGLTQMVAGARRALPGQMTLVLVDEHNQYKQGRLDVELNLAIADLLVSLEVDTVVVSSAEELASFVFHFTRALAEEPYKLAKRAVDAEAEFYMRGDNKHCVTVDQQGNGLSGLWQQMLGVLPHSSLETSRALLAALPSPRALAQALSADGGAARVAALGVARSGAPGARARRLGPDLALRLRKLFTTTDGNTLI